MTPILFGVLDDRSRLACHLQWYLAETAEVIAHGLSQAFQKRGLPRAALSDNGAAMTAAEITEGLTRLGVLHHTTLPYSPYQNAKQEAFWGPVEGRLIAMLEHVPDLTLELPERGHPGLGRARVQPQAPLRDRRGADHALPRRARCHAAVSRQRCAAPRLHPQRSSHPQEERRHHRHRGAPLRGAEPLSASHPHRGPLRRLESRPRPSRRRADRPCAGASLSAGQDPERQRPAPLARSGLLCRRPRADAGNAGVRHRALARAAARPQAATGLPPPYLPKHEQGDDT